MKNDSWVYHQKEQQKKLTDLWSSISLISEIGSLKYTGRGASATEDIVIYNQIERERYFVIVQFATDDKVIYNQNRKGKELKFCHCSV